MMKKDVPEINLVTKVSEMYWIEFSQKLNLFNANKLEKLKIELKNHPIRDYEVFFSSGYKNVVTEDNEETVKELNTLAGLINNFVNNDNLEYQCNLIIYFNSVHELIFSKQLR